MFNANILSTIEKEIEKIKNPYNCPYFRIYHRSTGTSYLLYKQGNMFSHIADLPVMKTKEERLTPTLKRQMKEFAMVEFTKRGRVLNSADGCVDYLELKHDLELVFFEGEPHLEYYLNIII